MTKAVENVDQYLELHDDVSRFKVVQNKLYVTMKSPRAKEVIAVLTDFHGVEFDDVHFPSKRLVFTLPKEPIFDD